MKKPLLSVLALCALPLSTLSCAESSVGGIEVVLTLNDTTEIWGTWLRQEGAAPLPALLLLHEPGAGRDRNDWDELWDPLHSAGFNVMAIDLRSHGESDATGTPADLRLDPAGYPQDVLAALRFLRGQAEEGDMIDPDRIGILGLGTAGSVAAAAVGRGHAQCAAAVSAKVEEVLAHAEGYTDQTGDDDDDSAEDDLDALDLHDIRWITGAEDTVHSAEATTLNEATTDGEVFSAPGSASGVQLMWDRTEVKEALIDWCIDHL